MAGIAMVGDATRREVEKPAGREQAFQSHQGEQRYQDSGELG